MRPLTSQLEDELKALWSGAPVSGQQVRELAPQVTYCLGATFDHGETAVTMLVELIHTHLTDKQRDALLSAYGLDKESSAFTSVDDRFGVVSKRYEKEGWPRTARRWAESGIVVLAQHIQASFIPAVALGVVVLPEEQNDGWRVEISKPTWFKDMHAIGASRGRLVQYDADRHSEVQWLSINLRDDCVIEFDLHSDSLPATLRNVAVGKDSILDMKWTGELGLYVTTQSRPGTVITVATYPQKVYVSVFPRTDFE